MSKQAAFAHEQKVAAVVGFVHYVARDQQGGAGAGQAVVTAPGEWVRYSTPEPDGAEYIAVCLPAFSMNTVHRDDE